MKHDNYKVMKGWSESTNRHAIQKDIVKVVIEWTDINGHDHKVVTDDLEVAETTIGLLTGNITLADLEVDHG